MTDESGAAAHKGKGRPAEHDELALLAYVTPRIDKNTTLDEACEGGLSFFDRPKLAAEKNAVTYRRRSLSEDTLKRQSGKARASLKIDVAGLAKHIPVETAAELAQQAWDNARFTRGGKPKIPEGFLPARKLKPGRPRKN